MAEVRYLCHTLGMPTTIVEPGMSERLTELDWKAIGAQLWEVGYALTPAFLTPEECAALIRLYPSKSVFRSHIIMARFRFGRGDYKYFDYPLPALVHQLREHSYAYLAPIANAWNRELRLREAFPAKHSDLLAICGKKGQTRATPLLLHYEAGDFNCLHQDLYGEVAFPLQLTCFLNQPGVDYEGGEFVLVEQQPRTQSKAEVITPELGQMVIFATRSRPAKGNRGYYRVNLRHGVSKVRRGTRFTLGVIYHDAA
ncbi:MAG TPA: 2OG-Fe(II) oxygenase [Terriglobales bacterium]|nr:2OG-Fe(II) oxygenase [Terriglobales bacterium]